MPAAAYGYRHWYTETEHTQIVLHKQGLFQYSKGKKILFCTGYDTVQHRIIDDFISHVVDSDITAIVLADGYKASCEIRRIIQCR